VMVQNGDLLADYYSFFQLLSVRRVSDVRQIEIHS
jgi:hypothetical protein